MKTNARLLTLALTCAALALVATLHAQDLAPPAAVAPEIERLRTPYLKNLGAIRAARDARSEPITRAYTATLERLESEATRRGEANVVEAAKAERERVAAKQEPTVNERKAMPAALAAVRTRYDSDLARNAAPFVQQEQQLTRQYVSSLGTEQRRLVAQNQVAKAAAVGAERETVAPSSTTKAPAVGFVPPAASTVRGKGQLDPALADKIAAAVASNSHERSASSGDSDGGAEIPEAGALLTGFEFMEVPTGSGTRVQALRTYFMTRKGVVAGADRGKINKVTDKVLARDGYAVAGLMTQAGPHTMGAIQVIFMKIDPGTGRFDTNSSSTYKSKWFGTKQRETPKQLGGDGRLVIGVFGKGGGDCDTIGLVLMK